MALAQFVSNSCGKITPKYPQVGVDSQFALPDRIDIATVGLHKLTLTQK
jgi:hypothetical protein